MSARARLFVLGFLGLFLELALIRWLPTRVWNLGYFPNFVLLSAFLGMGAGFLLHARVPERRSTAGLDLSALGALALMLLCELGTFGVPGFGAGAGSVGGELYFTRAPVVDGRWTELRFAGLFAGLLLVFAALTQRTAKVFARLPPLEAYTWDIAGSCAGIAAFMLLSWLQAPAHAWLLLMIPLYVLGGEDGERRPRWTPTLALGAACLLTAWRDAAPPLPLGEGGLHEARWSPYQRVEYLRRADGANMVLTNGIQHQSIVLPAELPASFYQAPHQSRRASGLPPYRSALIIGAGTGSDVAAALAAGAERVDAVEIDPAIAAIGREHNPSRPYQDARVRLVVDDGRAFMARTTERYDLVVLALTDSIVRASAHSQLRLENYLFTLESLRRARELLAPGGRFVMYNFYREPWLVERFASLLRAAFGSEPERLSRRRGFEVLVAAPGAPPREPAPGETLPVDDWPFPYLQRRAVPPFYAAAMGALAAAVALAGLLWSRGARAVPARPAAAFFLMGAAFLLLESKSVVQFSLLFGTTWINSSLVFLGVLLSVLAANRLAAARPALRPSLGLSAALVLACVGAYLFPLQRLLAVDPPALRVLLAALVGFAPIFFANLLFSAAFRDQRSAEALFGWNLLGAAMGGIAEYSSMVLGYSALALVVAALYSGAAALLLGARRA